MKRRTAIALGAGLPIAAGLTVVQRRRRFRNSALPLAQTDTEKQILDVISGAMRSGEVFLEVPASDGRMLRLLTEATGAKHVVEIGTSTGYSGLWFLLALHKTNGKLTTFEVDPGRAAIARRHFAQAGADDLVQLITGDAHATISHIKEPFDVLFLDADKEGYLDYLNRLLPLVRPGGLILAHNFNDADDYARAVIANPGLETLMPAGSLAITLKKR